MIMWHSFTINIPFTKRIAIFFNHSYYIKQEDMA